MKLQNLKLCVLPCLTFHKRNEIKGHVFVVVDLAVFWHFAA